MCLRQVHADASLAAVLNKLLLLITVMVQEQNFPEQNSGAAQSMDVGWMLSSHISGV